MDKENREDFDKDEVKEVAPDVDPETKTDEEGTPVENPSG